jgi:hypothetical protein
VRGFGFSHLFRCLSQTRTPWAESESVTKRTAAGRGCQNSISCSFGQVRLVTSIV